jgi:hypothetical protein
MSDISYPLTPDRVLESILDFDTISSEVQNAKEARRAKNGSGNPRRTFVLLHDHVSLVEMNAVRDFFIDRRGRWDRFNFTDPATSITYAVRFENDILDIEKALGRSENPRFTIEVKIREVL